MSRRHPPTGRRRPPCSSCCRCSRCPPRNSAGLRRRSWGSSHRRRGQFGRSDPAAPSLPSSSSLRRRSTSATARTLVVKAADGTEHTLRFVGRTSVHGGEATAKGTKDAFQGLKEGSEVVVHYSTKGTEETAEEIDHIGKGGLKTAEGTVTRVDRGAKAMTVKTADGAVATFRLTDRAEGSSSGRRGRPWPAARARCGRLPPCSGAGPCAAPA